MTRPTRQVPVALTIVALAPVARDPQRVRIMVRSGSQSRSRCVHVVSRERVKAMRIRVGSRWTAAAATRLAHEAAVDAAREALLSAIGRSRRTLGAGTLAARLDRAGHPQSAIDAAIAQMRTDGWISDRIRAT
jgi:hypothetical protein